MFALALATLWSCGGQSVQVGDPLPAWEEGDLDVHFINTARGECTYQILPDGTTFLVDASGAFWNYEDQETMPSKPSADVTAGRCIVDYINHFAPAVSEGHIDYFLLTHHHGDHCGVLHSSVPMHESGLFRLTSLAEVGTSLVMDRILDRDYPDFTYPTPDSQDKKLMENYKAFLDWTEANNGTHIEKWRVGCVDQLVPVHNPSCGASLRSYSGNGRFWTGGEDEDTYTLMPTTEEFEAGDPKAIPNENCLSCSYILSYGDFDFFLGGDLQHNDRDKYPYMDAETPVAKAAHKVEVMKANHHGCNYTHEAQLMEVLCPDVWVAGVWWNNSVNPTPVDRILAANPNCDLYCINTTKQIENDLGEERLKSVVSRSGHVVIRVAPEGKTFMVYVLEDTDEEYRVKSIHGPYMCTK